LLLLLVVGVRDVSFLSESFYKTMFHYYLVGRYINWIVIQSSFWGWLFVYIKPMLLYNAMGEVISVIPARCKSCGEIFNLAYDFELAEKEGQLFIDLLEKAARLGVHASLCWKCRAGLHL